MPCLSRVLILQALKKLLLLCKKHLELRPALELPIPLAQWVSTSSLPRSAGTRDSRWLKQRVSSV